MAPVENAAFINKQMRVKGKIILYENTLDYWVTDFLQDCQDFPLSPDHI